MSRVAKFMSIALEQAKLAFEAGEVPIGAVIAKEDRILAVAKNEMKAKQNPTCHAEILAIGQACKTLKSDRLVGCDIFITLEPCPMCLSAISFARISRIYFSVFDPKSGGISAGSGLVGASALHHKPVYYDGFGEEESRALLQAFFKERR